MTSHLLVDSPNRVTPQGGWPRRGVAAPSGTCILHTSEGPWQNGVNALTQFIRTRSDYGSYHRACDWADVAVYYPWEWEAWQDSETNPWAVGIAAACKTSDWAIMPADIREGYYRNMGRMAADFVAYMRDTHGVHVPLRRITGAQARARVPGFCAHGDSGVARSDPGADFDWGYFFHCTQEALGAGSISPASGNITPAKPKEDTLSAAEVKEIKDHVNAVMLGGYTWEGKKHPGIGMVVEENQRRIDRIPDRVWRETKVRRGGKDVSVLQDLADGTTYALASLDGDGLTADDLTAIRTEMDEAVEAVKGTVNVVVTPANPEPKEQP